MPRLSQIIDTKIQKCKLLNTSVGPGSSSIRRVDDSAISVRSQAPRSSKPRSATARHLAVHNGAGDRTTRHATRGRQGEGGASARNRARGFPSVVVGGGGAVVVEMERQRGVSVRICVCIVFTAVAYLLDQLTACDDIQYVTMYYLVMPIYVWTRVCCNCRDVIMHFKYGPMHCNTTRCVAHNVAQKTRIG